MIVIFHNGLCLSIHRGFHLAVIHSRPDVLTQLLALVATDSRLQPAVDEQNSLYQVHTHCVYLHSEYRVSLYKYPFGS